MKLFVCITDVLRIGTIVGAEIGWSCLPGSNTTVGGFLRSIRLEERKEGREQQISYIAYQERLPYCGPLGQYQADCMFTYVVIYFLGQETSPCSGYVSYGRSDKMKSFTREGTRRSRSWAFS